MCFPSGYLRLCKKEIEDTEAQEEEKLRFQCPRWRTDKPHFHFFAVEFLLKMRSGQSRK